jgi:Carboxypeptidase regulatory-like domain
MSSRRLIAYFRTWITFPMFVLSLNAVWTPAQTLSALQAPRESVHPKSDFYRIAGRTASAADGHILPGATVRIVNTKTQQLVASTLSGEDGGFEFKELKADKYSLSAVIDGYLISPYDEHENFSSAIVTGAGVDTESLVLRITPAAIISGRVVDEVGDPVRVGTVMLYRENREEGKSHISAMRRVQTNDLGEYEFVSLPPGNYFMSASAMPWYAVHPRLVGSEKLGRTVRQVDPSLDVAYPTTFYADTTDGEGATPIPVRVGNQIDIDIHLQPSPAVTLTIHTKPGQQSPHYLQLQESVFGQPEETNGQMQVDDSGTSLVAVPPGHYVLRHMNQTTGSAKSMAVDLEKDNFDLDEMSGEESATVKMHLEVENGVKMSTVTQVVLRNKNGEITAASVEDKGEAQIYWGKGR